MTWVGWLLLFIFALGFVGNAMQYKGYKTLNEAPKVKRLLMLGLWGAVILHIVALLGILFVGTPPLF